MKTLIAIPARMASVRFPNKPMIMIDGKPMIQRVWEKAIESDLGKVIVACCEDEVFNLITSIGGQAILTNPDLPSGTDRVYEAIKNLDGVELAMEFFAEMGPGGVSSIADLYQASKNSQYLLNGNSHSLADFIHLTDNMTDEELAQVTFNVTNNDAIKNPLEARRSDGIIKNNLDTRVTEQGDRNKLFTLEKELTELESTPEANRSQSKKNQIAAISLFLLLQKNRLNI